MAEFPYSQIEGCHTDWKRELRTNMGRCGILNHSDDDTTIQSWCRMLLCLSLVPTSDVLQIYTTNILPLMPKVDEDAEQDDDDKAANFSRALEGYISYFERKLRKTLTKPPMAQLKPNKQREKTDNSCSKLSNGCNSCQQT